MSDPKRFIPVMDLPRFDDFDDYEIRNPKDTYQVMQFQKYLTDVGYGFIAGGVFKNVFTGQEVRDIDFFFKSQADFELAERKLYADRGYEFAYETPRAVGFRNIKTGVIVELIFIFFGTPCEILNTFDFTVCKVAMEKETLYTHPEFFEHLTLKRLVIGPKLYNPVNTFERSYKYTRYGFGLCRESKVNLLTAIKEDDLAFGNLVNSMYSGID